MRYTVTLEWDEEGQGWFVRVPALPGCLTQGYTVEEALANAQDAIELHISGLRAHGDPVPEEHDPAILIHQVEVKAA